MNDATIPGLEVPGLSTGAATDGPLVRSARITLRALAEADAIQPRHAVLVTLVESLAGAIDRGVQSGRASAVAMAAKQLLETMLVLDPPPEAAVGAADARAALDAFVRVLEDHANDPEAAGRE